MKQYSGTFSKVARVLVLVLAITACETPEETASPSDGGDDGGGVTAPVVGMDCGSSSIGTGNVNTSTTTSKAFFVADVPGTAITSLKMYLKESTCGNGTTCVTPLTLKVYTCGDTNSLGTLVDTVSISAGMRGYIQEFTFTFSSPITIPTCSNGSEKGFVFQFTNNWSNNVQSDIQVSSPSTCYLDKGNSHTGAESYGVSNNGIAQYYRAVITATP